MNFHNVRDKVTYKTSYVSEEMIHAKPYGSMLHYRARSSLADIPYYVNHLFWREFLYAWFIESKVICCQATTMKSIPEKTYTMIYWLGKNA